VIPAAIYATDTWKRTRRISHKLDVDAYVPYWACHGETTLLMMSWWRRLGWRTYWLLSQ